VSDDLIGEVMSQQAATPQVETGLERDVREGARAISGDWWVWLIAGILWIVVSLVILQFDNASITTVGILVGVMFLLAGVQSIAFTAVPGAVRWVSLMFGALFLIAAIICFVNPADTFATLAEIIGFLFLLVGVWWMIRAFLERPLNPLWWLGLIAGILMVILAFWAAGQFFIEKAYVLLVFAGIWALMEGITDISRAFALSELHEDVRSARG
jgi:uncharacterized membrane protein HdeD (DUF308 family)